ncbi:ATP/GTP-binding protein [Streptomyces sp. NPDC094468]|uniref:ATP/GTP-binding protein n=1 Tax=Streptomyces sp. NPDC094468 TaxID=3366066 RepID=UPI00382FC565
MGDEVDGNEPDRSRTGLLIQRLTAVVGALALAPAGAAYAGGGPDVGAGKCQVIKFCVEAGSGDRSGDGHAGGTHEGSHNADSEIDCKYTKVEPKPPAAHPAWKGADPKTHDLYFYGCTDGPEENPDGFVVVPTGQTPAPRIDPRELAEHAVDSMTLLGPDTASPRAAGAYTVGVPMWMWVNRSATTYGPNTASASAGGITVTATAGVSHIAWSMGDGSTVTCNGPGTPYVASAGMTQSPTCGHVYGRPSARSQNRTFPVTATATWSISWHGGGQAGRLTEIRQTTVRVSVGEVQVLR